MLNQIVKIFFIIKYYKILTKILFCTTIMLFYGICYFQCMH